jgi:hypothetical protein
METQNSCCLKQYRQRKKLLQAFILIFVAYKSKYPAKNERNIKTEKNEEIK